MKTTSVLYVAALVLGAAFLVSAYYLTEPSRMLSIQTSSLWEIRSIDTMKTSRDLAQEKTGDGSFNSVIDQQVRAIRDTGATHVAVGTPYDEEFIPYLTRWVTAARRQGLNVWFRGNFAGWEQWFGYPAMTRAQHTTALENFLTLNMELFEDGDMFTSCPECENGGPGDPRETGDVAGHREFLIREFSITKTRFEATGKHVRTGFYSMNYDVASLVMDRATTEALGNVVTIDHYVSKTSTLVRDISAIASASGGRVVLGEFGYPIPDIHGAASDAMQETWLADSLSQLRKNPNLIGLNYWVHSGGTTGLWDDDGQPKPAQTVLRDYYGLKILEGQVTTSGHAPMEGTVIKTGSSVSTTDQNGTFFLEIRPGDSVLTISHEGYTPATVSLNNSPQRQTVILAPPAILYGTAAIQWFTDIFSR